MVFKKNKIITIANSFLALLMLSAFLFLAREIISFSLAASKKPPQVSSVQHKDTRGKGLMDYNQILKRNPFGFYAGELRQLSSASGGSSQQSASQSDITLVGTISGHRKFAYAIFADKNNLQEIFKLGESVFGLGKLQRVEKDKVVLSNGGKTIEIKIANIVTIRESRLPDTKADSFSGDKFARRMADTSYIVDGQKVQQAIANPNQIMTDARLLPNVVDGRQEGFVLREVSPGGIYQSLGLHNGDILLRINEYNISNPESALQAFTALKGLDRVQLDIIRSGSRMTMNYQIR
jgi:general secretion pathway protein C